MDKISGKHNIDQRFLPRPDTGKSENEIMPVSQKLVKPIQNVEE